MTLPALQSENTRPGHVALVARLEKAAEEIGCDNCTDEPISTEGHGALRAELDVARRELLALMGAMADALEEAAEREGAPRPGMTPGAFVRGILRRCDHCPAVQP